MAKKGFKPAEKIMTACPYLTAEQAQSIWNKAKEMARQKCKSRRMYYWPTVNLIAMRMAKKLDQTLRDADEDQWLKEQEDKGE